MDVPTTFIPDAEPPVLVAPGQRPLHRPAGLAQPLLCLESLTSQHVTPSPEIVERQPRRRVRVETLCIHCHVFRRTLGFDFVARQLDGAGRGSLVPILCCHACKKT